MREYKLTSSFSRVKLLEVLFYSFVLLFIISAVTFYPRMEFLQFSFLGLALATFFAGLFMKENNPKIIGTIKFDLDNIQINTENKVWKISKPEIKNITTHLNGYKGLKRLMLLRPYESNGFYNQIKVITNNRTHSFYLYISSKKEFEELKIIKKWLHA